MLKLVLVAGIAAGLCYMGALVYFYITQRRLQYFPSHRDTEGKGDGIFRPWLTDQGAFLGYIRGSDNPKWGVILFHGTQGEALDRVWLSELVPDSDVLLLLPEYPGYGGKQGSPTEASIYAAAEFCWMEARRRWKIPFTLLGESLGGAVASHVAAKSVEKGAERIALISPFTSATEVAKRHYFFFPVQWMHRDKFETEKLLRNIQLPIHIIHGTLDQVTPIDLGRKLLNDYSASSKALTAIPGYGHDNISSAAVDSPFAEEFRAFVRGEGHHVNP